MLVDTRKCAVEKYWLSFLVAGFQHQTPGVVVAWITGSRIGREGSSRGSDAGQSLEVCAAHLGGLDALGAGADGIGSAARSHRLNQAPDGFRVRPILRWSPVLFPALRTARPRPASRGLVGRRSRDRVLPMTGQPGVRPRTRLCSGEPEQLAARPLPTPSHNPPTMELILGEEKFRIREATKGTQKEAEAGGETPSQAGASQHGR